MTAGIAPEDSFWRAFHREHPEVDLVLLPDPALTARPGDAATIGPDVAEQVGAVADRLLDELDERLTGRAGWPAVVPRSRVWRRDPLQRRYLECRLAVGDLAPDQPVPLLRAVGNAFLAAGWRARPLPGDRPRLVARRESFRATAEVTPDALHLVLRSGLLAAEETPR
jgi:hypothetical protein